MICPYRKRTEVRTDVPYNTITIEKYMPCYKEECPYYMSEERARAMGWGISDYCEKASEEIN